MECDTTLESSQQELQLYFKPHPDRRSEQKVMAPQSYESPTLTISRLSFGSPETKRPFGSGRHREAQRILYGGRWWFPSNLGRGESYESKVARG
jgi:hypothetical protein